MICNEQKEHLLAIRFHIQYVFLKMVCSKRKNQIPTQTIIDLFANPVFKKK